MLLRARARQAVVAPIFLGLLDEHIQHPQPLDDPPSGIGIEILVIVDEQLPPGHRRKARQEGVIIEAEEPIRDRKSVVKGKRVSGRVDLGGRRIIKKKKKKEKRRKRNN